MRLNVYLISHPIIRKLSTQIRYSISSNYYIQKKYRLLQNIYILLVYEVVRKWMKVNNIYIKNIDNIKELTLFTPKESYLIITNLMNCGNIINEINDLLPKSYIQHLDCNQNNIINDNCLDNEIIHIIQEAKIIIIDNVLTTSTNKLLHYLTQQKQIEISQIKIICITCNNKVLETIGDKYPLLNIYTTKIYPY
uniref:Uracil phosphoribosyltransferase n=1 Tax=Riquetophycus sp. TaxID=1897556 RepID=A0A1C9C8B8_9FLOR|nr:uracil phosphoribosyltransferase [Riquetophycus sp.]